MGRFFIQPEYYFYWFDVLLSFSLLVLSVFLFIKHKRGYMTPILLLGLFLFPLQFSIWFLPTRMQLSEAYGINILEVFYLLFIKICFLISLLLSRR
jgi:hypothetical protein